MGCDSASDREVPPQVAVLRAVGRGQEVRDEGIPRRRVAAAKGGWGDVAGASQGPFEVTGLHIGGFRSPDQVEIWYYWIFVGMISTVSSFHT